MSDATSGPFYDDFKTWRINVMVTEAIKPQNDSSIEDYWSRISLR